VLAPLPVTELKVEELATVMVPEPLLVVVISAPAAIVKVLPRDTVEFDPEFPAKVIDELAKLALVIPAAPERLEFVKPVIVLEPAAIEAPVIAPAPVTTIDGVLM